ncbi:MAG: ergot alkaloid biosynthesis protein, partial [Proteobacteria bacterium]
MSLVLVTGGSGKTARRVTAGLRARGLETRVASRSATGAGTVRFDWADPATFDAALAGVSAAYLVAPTSVTDPQPSMEAFLAQAVARGVR